MGETLKRTEKEVKKTEKPLRVATQVALARAFAATGIYTPGEILEFIEITLEESTEEKKK